MSDARRERHVAIIVAALLMLAGIVGLACLFQQPYKTILERIRHDGVIHVAIRRSPSTYYDGADGPDGFDYALVNGFAAHLGVVPRFTFPATLATLLDETRHGEVQMAAGALAITPARANLLAFSRPYDKLIEQIVYRRGGTRPASIDDIAANALHVVALSSHAETLCDLRHSTHSDLTWTTHDDIGVSDLLAALDRAELPLVIADSNVVRIARRLHKHIAVAFDVGEAREIAWAFPAFGDDSLRDAADAYLAMIDDNGELQRLRARYFAHTGRLNFVDTREFWRAVRDRLPQYQALFEEAAGITGIDWRLLAAIGYQESHWRDDAVSPTGVRGIMMLTQDTARQVDVSDRNDPAQSIIGGARYLRIVEEKIPARIDEPNRLWLTLAGYNIGFGHLEDARILTERDGADPDLWMDVKQRLPLLAKKAYYTTVKHGVARGAEPVGYVDNIRNFFDMLVWYSGLSPAEQQRQLADEDDR